MQYPQILTMKGSSVYSLVNEAIQGLHLEIQNLDIACEVRYLSTAISLVEAEIGIAILQKLHLCLPICQMYCHVKLLIFQ